MRRVVNLFGYYSTVPSPFSHIYFVSYVCYTTLHYGGWFQEGSRLACMMLLLLFCRKHSSLLKSSSYSCHRRKYRLQTNVTLCTIKGEPFEHFPRSFLNLFSSVVS